MIKKIVLPVLLILSASSISEASSFINHFQTSHGFSISLPYGWYSAPEPGMKNFSSKIHLQGGHKYYYGYQIGSGPDWFYKFPYILVSVNTTQRVHEDEFKNINDITKKIKKSMLLFNDNNEETIDDITVDEVGYDEDAKTFFSVISTTYVSGEVLKKMTATILTASGDIRVNYYSNDNEFEKNLTLFKEIISKVSLDEGMVYTHPSEEKKTKQAKQYSGIINFKSRSTKIYALSAMIFCLPLIRRYLKKYNIK